MPEDENLRIVRGIYEAVERRDPAAAFAVYADDVVWDFSRSARSLLMTTPVFQGHEGVRGAWRDTLTVFGAMDYDVLGLQAVGDRVLATVRDRATGRTSGLAVEATHYAVWKLEGGLVVRLDVFDDHAEAAEATGLHVHVAQLAVDAWNRRDLDGLLRLCHPDLVWTSAIKGEVEGGEATYHGHDGMRRFWQEWQSLWELDIEITGVRQAGGRLVGLGVIRTRGASGIAVESPVAYVFEFELGLIHRLRAYLDHAEALAAAGMA